VVVTTNGPEGSLGNLDAVIERMQKQIIDRPATVHIVMLATTGLQSTGRVTGAVQTQVGTAVAKM